MRFKEWFLNEMVGITYGGVVGPRAADAPINPESGVMGLSKYIATPTAEPKTGYEKAIGKKTPDKTKEVTGFDAEDRKNLAKRQGDHINSFGPGTPRRIPVPYTN